MKTVKEVSELTGVSIRTKTCESDRSRIPFV